MLNPNVTFPYMVFVGVGSMRPPPVNFPMGHCCSPPAQKLGLCGGASTRDESWQAAASNAAAARPVSMLGLLDLGNMCVVSSPAHGSCYTLRCRRRTQRRCHRWGGSEDVERTRHATIVATPRRCG